MTKCSLDLKILSRPDQDQYLVLTDQDFKFDTKTKSLAEPCSLMKWSCLNSLPGNQVDILLKTSKKFGENIFLEIEIGQMSSKDFKVKI